MRLRQRDQRVVVIKKRIPVTEPDGTTYQDWEPVGQTIHANVQPAGGRAMAEVYGLRLAYMLTMIVPIDTPIQESDGVCIWDSSPDYKVVAIKTWSQHKVVDLERIRA